MTTLRGLAEIYVNEEGLGEATVLALGFEYKPGQGARQLAGALTAAEGACALAKPEAHAEIVERFLATVLQVRTI